MKYPHDKSIHLSRRIRVRKSLTTSSSRPRLHVYRSNRYIYSQIIDDQKGVVLVSACEKELELKTTITKTEKAALIGELIAKKAKAKKITLVAFDRGSYRYHGRIKSLADGARKGGLDF